MGTDTSYQIIDVVGVRVPFLLKWRDVKATHFTLCLHRLRWTDRAGLYSRHANTSSAKTRLLLSRDVTAKMWSRRFAGISILEYEPRSSYDNKLDTCILIRGWLLNVIDLYCIVMTKNECTRSLIFLLNNTRLRKAECIVKGKMEGQVYWIRQ